MIGMNAQRRVAVFMVVVCVLASAACGRDQESTPPLSSSVQGWWITTQGGECICPTQPECQGSDCVSYVVLGLTPDQRYYDGQVSVSRKLGTMSSVGALSRGTYRVVGDSVMITQPSVPETSFRARVSANELTLGTRIETRASSALSSALDSAVSAGSERWKSAQAPQVP